MLQKMILAKIMTTTQLTIKEFPAEVEVMLGEHVLVAV